MVGELGYGFVTAHAETHSGSPRKRARFPVARIRARPLQAAGPRLEIEILCAFHIASAAALEFIGDFGIVPACDTVAKG